MRTAIKVLLACETVSVALIVSLWFRHAQDKTLKKLFWSLILLIPVIGWLFYLAFYVPPSSQGRAEQAEGTFSGWYP